MVTLYHLEQHAEIPDCSGSSGEILVLLPEHRLGELTGAFGVPPQIANQFREGWASKSESHPGFDFISLLVPKRNGRNQAFHLCAYFRKNLLLLYSDNPGEYGKIRRLFEELDIHSYPNGGLARLLCAYLDQLIHDDAQVLEDLEQRIFELEDQLLTGKKSDCVKEIVAFRRKLTPLKRFYDGLYAIAQAAEENDNGLVPKNELRYFKMLRQRADRLGQSVLTLREYVAQVREAYQAQVDINLNNLMKIFTVVTVIFLPLTLIAGWYGMNFDMPEYRLSFGYPLVIAASLLILAVCLILFKRKKWF